MIPELITPHLRLIRLNRSHLADLHSVCADEEAMQYWDDFPHINLAQTEDLLELLLSRIESGTGVSWGITRKENPAQVIGIISYNSYQQDGLATVGYILSRSYWNQGIMIEALSECIKYGFFALGVHRIEAQVEPGNAVSERLLANIGFIREGLLRERHYYKEKYQDLIIYGLLETDVRS